MSSIYKLPKDTITAAAAAATTATATATSATAITSFLLKRQLSS